MSRTRIIVTIKRKHYENIVKEIKRCESSKLFIDQKYLGFEPMRDAISLALPKELKEVKVLGFSLSIETEYNGKTLHSLTFEFISD